MSSSAPPSDQFYNVLLEMLERMATRFSTIPEINQTLVLGQGFKGNSMVQEGLRKAWASLTETKIDEVLSRNVEVVCEIISTSDLDLLKNVQFERIVTDPLVEEETKQSLLEYIRILTILSHQGTATEIDAQRVAATNLQPKVVANPTTTASSAAQTQATAVPNTATNTNTGRGTAPTPAPVAPANPSQAIESVLNALPKFVETFNQIMEKDDGNNAFAQMAKQFMNPNQLQTGVANNMAANAFQAMQENPSVMEDVQNELGATYTADYIVKRLQKLDQIELQAKAAELQQALGAGKKKKKNRK